MKANGLPVNSTETSFRIVTWQTADEMRQGWPVIRQMYSKLTETDYVERLRQLEPLNYRQFAS